MSNGARLAAAEQVQSDRRRMFGFSGGTPFMIMDAKKSGLDCNPIEGGRLLMFAPGKDGYLGGYDPIKKRYPKMYVDMMPSDYASMVDRKFHTNEDFGFRLLPMLTGLEYSNVRRVDEKGQTVYDYHDQADAYFNVVHPTLAECSYGLNKKVQLNDPEIGEGELVFQVCPTCQLALLESEETSKRIFNASTVLESKILLELREALIDAYRAALNHVDRKHQAVLSDIARKMTGTQNGRNTLNTIDRIHLKMMHRTENAKNDGQLDMMRAIVQEVASAVRPTAIAASEAPSGVTITAEEAAEYEAYKMRRDNMAKARAAKEKNNESNSESGQ